MDFIGAKQSLLSLASYWTATTWILMQNMRKTSGFKRRQWSMLQGMNWCTRLYLLTSDKCSIWFAYGNDNWESNAQWDCGPSSCEWNNNGGVNGVVTVDIPSSTGKTLLWIAMPIAPIHPLQHRPVCIRPLPSFKTACFAHILHQNPRRCRPIRCQ
eukprot:39388_1